MSSLYIDLNGVDSKTKMLIFGFVTQNCMIFALNIPDPLIMIILAFFYLMESFKSVNGDGLQITNNGLTIKRIGKNGFNAYGAIGIDPQSKTLNTWRIKIDERKSAVMIGLIAIATDSEIQWISKKAHYILFCHRSMSKIFCSGSSSHKMEDVIAKSGDIITMALDLQNRKLYFTINDVQHEAILSPNISDKDLKYYLVCKLLDSDIGQQMSIVDFSCTVIKPNS